MPRPAIALTALLVCASLASTACESSSTNVLGPSGTKCGIALPTSVPTLAPGGGPGTLTVTVAAECVWRASSNADWIAITDNANGQGPGVVRFVASGNPTALMRRAAVIVGEARVELSQGGAPCQFTLTPATQTLGTEGGEGSVGVAVIDGCQWAATSTAPWLSVVGTPSGTGTGTIGYRVDANTGATRSATLRIADRTFAVNQAGTGTPCSVSLGQSEQSVAASGGDDVVSVIAAGDCPWTATSHAAWITVTSGASGTGTGTVRLSIAPNAGGQRVGLVTITGHTYAVTQAGAAGTCFYSIAAPGQSAPAVATTASVGVAASSGCPWTALSQAPWITITSGNTGNGNGAVSLAMATNPGATRVGVVTVAGFSYTVTQEAAGTTPTPCSYGIDATQLSAPPAETTRAVAVTAAAGCSWTASSQVGWITVTSGASGSGNGTVNVTVAANTGGARTGAVTIAGQTYTVTQQAAPSSPPCTYSINHTELAAPATGATNAVNVTAGAGCSWTATTEVGWITVASGGSGTGNGTVTINVAANAGAARTGVVTIAGHPYTVTQQAASSSPPCTYSINNAELAAPATGATNAVNVTAGAGCSWTATSAISWITVASGGGGSGNGTVTINVAANAGAARTGIATIAGHTYTVTQAAGTTPCSYQLGASEQSVTAPGGPVAVTVTASTGCGWTAASQVSWITVASGASGSGNGSVQLTVAANSAAQRVGTVTIAGQTFTVTQAAAACSYSINPTTQTVSLLGGSFSVEITTQAWCTWTATTEDSWIQMTGATTGAGNGRLTYNVPLVLFSRTGTVTISGRVLTVNQRALLSNDR